MSTVSLAEKAFRRCSSLCARSEQCENDIHVRVVRWGLSEAEANEVVERLRSEGFVDNRRYARAFVHDRWHYNHWGRLKIINTLRTKRVSQDIIDEAILRIDPEEYAAELEKILRAKYATMADVDPRLQRNRLHQFASGRGFEMQVVLPALNAIFSGVDYER